MGYSLFWVETLAAALLLMALVTAVSAHMNRRWHPAMLLAFVFLVSAAVAGNIASIVVRQEFGFPTVALVLVAFATWIFARSQRSLYRWYFPILSFLLVLSAAVVVNFFTSLLRFGHPYSWFWYTTSWSIGFALASPVIIFRGLRANKETGQPGGRDWSRARLVVASAAAVALAGITLSNMDLALRMQLATERVETGARLLSLRPAPVSDRDNAALIYQKAFEVMVAPEKMKPAWKGVFEDDFDPRSADLRRFLDSQAAALKFLRQAALKPDCVFEHDYSEGYEMRIPEVQSLKAGGTLLAADAVCRAALGDAQTAIADLNAVFGIVNHLKSQPFLISLIAASAAESEGARAFERVLAQSASSPQKGIESLPLKDLSFPPRPTFSQLLPRCLQIEEVAGVQVFLDLSYFDRSSDSGIFYPEIGGAAGAYFLSSVLYRVFLLPDDLATYRKELKTVRLAMDKPYEESVKTLNDSFDRQRFPGFLTRLLLPAANRILTAAARADATDQLVHAAKACVAYQENAKGKYPERLEDLVPKYLEKLPLDPFDGKPLRMKKGDKGLILYSVGPNLKDDGGIRAKGNIMEGDLVFQLP